MFGIESAIFKFHLILLENYKKDEVRIIKRPPPFLLSAIVANAFPFQSQTSFCGVELLVSRTTFNCNLKGQGVISSGSQSHNQRPQVLWPVIGRLEILSLGKLKKYIIF